MVFRVGPSQVNTKTTCGRGRSPRAEIALCGQSALLAACLIVHLAGWPVSQAASAAESSAAEVAQDEHVLDVELPLDSMRAAVPDTATNPESATRNSAATSRLMLASVTIFGLAVFLGVELISKVPPTLHTPLMSGSNAISGITLVGALIATMARDFDGGTVLGLIAIVFATVNVVGGFLVTHRMLAMFRKR